MFGSCFSHLVFVGASSHSCVVFVVVVVVVVSVENQQARELISARKTSREHKRMYLWWRLCTLYFARMPGESYRKLFRSVLFVCQLSGAD